jgi:DNA-binding transcriptional ArsR family regulator
MHYQDISRLATLVGDDTRALALVSLMDGRALPAGELARITNVSPATMSSHLSKMVEGGLLRVEAQGKHRYYRIAGPKVATLLETFGTLVRLPAVPKLTARVPGDLRYARTCYRHLAGYVAVELNRAAQQQGYWRLSRKNKKEYQLSRAGERWLESLGVDPAPAHRSSGFARACLDWSERRHHVAGALGTMLLDRFLELKWLARVDGSRAVRVTIQGQEELRKQMGLLFVRE